MATPALEDIPFSGLSLRADANRTPFGAALIASDCITDRDSVMGRPGSRAATPSAIAATGTVQHAGLFRPADTSQRIIEVIAGEVWIVTNPTTETGSNGSAFSLGVKFGTTDNISGCQINNSYYLASSVAGTPPWRVNWDGLGDANANYSIETLAQYPAPAKPTSAATTTISWTLFSGLSTYATSGVVIQTNANTGWANMPASWRGFTKTTNTLTAPDPNSYVQYKISNTPMDLTGDDWLLVAISPITNGGGNLDGEVEIALAIETGGVPGTFNRVGVTHDTPGPGGSPSYVFCDLRTLTSAVRSKVQYLQFKLDQPVGGVFMIYGYMILPAAPTSGTETYYVDLYNCSTGQQSDLSPGLDVTPGAVSLAGFTNAHFDRGSPSSNFSLAAVYDPSVLANYCYNTSTPLITPFPDSSEIGAAILISGTTPTPYTGSLTVRLWKVTDTAIRLVNATSGVNLTCPDTNALAQNTAYSLADNGSLSTLGNLGYKAGGTLPACNSLTAHAQRLVALGVGQHGNRVYISSYVPTSDTTHPFPQFPAIALEDADGWSFDITPSPTERGLLVNGAGDAVYICMTESVFAMTDLSPNSAPILVLKKGIVGRQAGGYFEDRFLWVSQDGIYMAAGKSYGAELSFEVRRYILDTFLPDSTACIGYSSLERAMYVIKGTSYLRYSFPMERWTTGTLGFSTVAMLSFVGLIASGVLSTTPQLWLFTMGWTIGRWQSSATRDMEVGTDGTTGTAIPPWVYSTGFARTTEPGIVKAILVDSTAVVEVVISRTSAGNMPGEARQIEYPPVAYQDEVWKPAASDLRAYKFRVQFTGEQTATLRVAEWSRSLVSAVGGAN